MSLLRAFVIWLIIIGTETVHGILRALFLVPVVGEFRARQIGAFIGSMLIFGITYLTIQWINVQHNKSLFLVGIFWLILTLFFEFILGREVLGLEWSRLLSDYDVPNGGLMPFALLFLVFTPLIAKRLKGLYSK